MKKHKILIFEDEINSIRGAFDFANALYFNGELDFKFASKSQEVNFGQLESYSMIFIDITLANKTAMDGYGVVSKIIERGTFPIEHIRILTGNSKVQDGLSVRNLPVNEIKVLYKPVDFNDISKEILQVLPDYQQVAQD